MIDSNQAIPFIKTGQALQSLRDSGYSFEAALGEVIDNSIEANANSINIHLFEGTSKRGKKCVEKLAIVDDGSGMDSNVLHHYPQIGYSTRYMKTNTIGKYGVGAKLAALNFATRFDVWSRTTPSSEWLHVYFDLEETMKQEEKGEQLSVLPPTLSKLPDELLELLPDGTGTVVQWSKIDRLEEGRYAITYEELKGNVEKELSRIFRYFIDGGISITLNNRKLLPHDNLYLLKNSYADTILKKHYKGLKEGGKDQVKDHYEPTSIADEEIQIDKSKARLRVTLYPKEVIRQRFKGGDELAKKLRLPENEGSISFIRLNREVSYTNVPRIFPRGVQEADRFIGIEVAFDPNLDEYFGVRNVKRGVEPHSHLRREIRTRLDKYLKEARKLLEETWGKASKEARDHDGQHSTITDAASQANKVMPKGKAKGPADKDEEESILDDLAKDVVGDDQEEQEQYKEKIKDLPFIIESVDFPGTQFIDLRHISNKVIIRLNTRHKFYREMWQPIKSIAESDAGTVTGDEAVNVARRTIEALTLLLIGYGKAESMDENPEAQYRNLTNYWGQFLDTLMSKVKNVV